MVNHLLQMARRRFSVSNWITAICRFVFYMGGAVFFQRQRGRPEPAFFHRQRGRPEPGHVFKSRQSHSNDTIRVIFSSKPNLKPNLSQTLGHANRAPRTYTQHQRGLRSFADDLRPRESIKYALRGRLAWPKVWKGARVKIRDRSLFW